MTMAKRLPVFNNEEEEKEFWAAHDSTDILIGNMLKR